MLGNSQIESIVAEKKTCFFISPHLDDAVLSAGSLISYLAKRTRVVVATVFTRAEDPPYTHSAKVYLKQCGYKDANQLFVDRCREDRRVCRLLGAEAVQLGFVDALWRRRIEYKPWDRWVGRILPEWNHRYPVYRWHIVSGNTHKDDQEMKQKLVWELRRLVSGLGEDQYSIFSSLGIGNHIDHVLTREACMEAFERLTVWSDFPYNVRKDASVVLPEDRILKRRWLPLTLHEKMPDKKKMIQLYQTQIAAMFPDRIIPSVPETYYALTGDMIPDGESVDASSVLSNIS